ncbi:hypothetical protein LINGRAHAP2_LOCUS30456 [Linum grandiflorum]
MERYRCALMLRRLLCGDRNRHRVGDVFTNEQCHVDPRTYGFDNSAPGSLYELQRSKWVISHSFDHQTTHRQNLFVTASGSITDSIPECYLEK